MIRFSEETHQYFDGDKELISVTQLLKKHGIAPDYGAVSPELLEAAASKGKIVHREIEEYETNGTIGFTDEFAEYRKARRPEWKAIANELIVGNDIVAGTADMIVEPLEVVDFKTTSTVHTEYVRWQTSIYAYLFGRMIGKDVERISCIHLPVGKGRYIKLPRVPDAEIERLFECERHGELYKPALPAIPQSLMDTVVELEREAKRIEEQKKTLKEELLNAMEKAGIKKLENDQLTITYTFPTTKNQVDSKKLKEAFPDVYEQCTKTSKVSASVRITVKE